MWLIGLLLPVCFVPGLTGATVPSQWELLSAVLPLALWRGGQSIFLYSLWVAFIGYALVSLRWTVSVNDSIHAIWIISIWALSFLLGSTLNSLVSLWKGLAVGMSVSSAVAVAQALGYHPVETYAGAPGLFYNTTVAGACAALVVAALCCRGLWFYIPGVLPGLILAQSRGAWLVIAVALICKYVHWTVALAALFAAAAGFYFLRGHSDVLRLYVWHVAWLNLSPLGVGPGTFSNLWFQFNGQIERPGFAHNDYLQLWFEYGAGSLAVLGIMAVALAQTGEAEWPVFAAFACLSLFYFPLYCPLPAFIGWIVAGHITRGWHLLRGRDADCRPDDAPGLDTFGYPHGYPWVPAISVERA